MTSVNDRIFIELDNISKKMDTMSEKILDLCTRTSLNEHEIKDVIETKVKATTKKWKIATAAFSCVATLSAVYNTLRH